MFIPQFWITNWVKGIKSVALGSQSFSSWILQEISQNSKVLRERERKRIERERKNLGHQFASVWSKGSDHLDINGQKTKMPSNP